MTQSVANNILSGAIQHQSSEDTLDDHRVSHTCNNMFCEKKWDPQQAVKKAERPEEVWNGHLVFGHYHGMSWSKTNTRALWSRGSKMFLRKFVWSKQLAFPRSASQCNGKRHLREHYAGNILGMQTDCPMPSNLKILGQGQMLKVYVELKAWPLSVMSVCLSQTCAHQSLSSTHALPLCPSY